MHNTATFRKRLSPQGRVLRHVVGHLSVPALVVPVPQMVDQLPDIEQFLRVLSPDPEQVIDVPKILPFDVPMRAVLRVTQLVEQLVEVPTIISFSSLQRTVEQLRRHSSSRWWRIQVLIFKVFPLDRVQQRCLPPRNAFLSGMWSRSLTLFLVEVFMVLSQDTAHLLLNLPAGFEQRADEPGEGFFRTFPQN